MASEIERLAGGEIADLLSSVQAGDRLSSASVLRLWNTHDLTSLGVLANLARERISGKAAYFLTAFHANYTRLPLASCLLCSRLSRPGAGAMTAAEWHGVLAEAAPEGPLELHLTGGPDPSLGVEDLCRLVRATKDYSSALRLRAFTWGELEKAAEQEDRCPFEILAALADAGLTSLAGGTLVDLTPQQPHLVADSIKKIESRVPWIQAAATLGLRCELTWVFGNDDDPEVLVNTLAFIRGLQDSWQIFDCFTPLVFQWPTEEIEIPMPTGYNQLRAIAIGRLFLDNIPRVRGCCSSLTESLAQVAQWYGADDAGSAVVKANKALQSFSPLDSVPGQERLEELLRATGRDPINILAL